MKINRMADEKKTPSWLFENAKTTDYLQKQDVRLDEINRIASLSLADDDQIVMEKDKLEKCASEKSDYYCNIKWSDSVRSELKEYAMICGMDISRFKTVDPDDFVEASSETKVVKTASAAPASKIIIDAFKLDDVKDVDYKDKNWQSIKRQANLEDKPVMRSGIIPVRGGEDYFTNSEVKVARGQNSISDPRAIETLAKSEKEDTGARLRREHQEKEAQKEANKKEWEQQKIAGMGDTSIVPKGKVFPTEVLNAQPGLGAPSSQMGVYAKFDPKDIPDKTQGELLSEAQDQRRKSIQRPEAEEHQFASKKASVREISDVFGEALKKALGGK